MNLSYITPAMIGKVMGEIPFVPPVAVKPVQLSDRLWELHGKCADRTATHDELDELDALCARLEQEG